MKRIMAAILCIGIAVSLCACGAGEKDSPATAGTADVYRVKSPMQYPVYTVSEAPTTDELRETAVRAMRDMLTIQWSANKFYTYEKTGAVSGKLFSYVPEVTFAGLPYTNGDSNIFTWFEYYDQQTGMLNFPGDGQELNATLGNTCTGSIMFGWATVCHTLNGKYDNFHMVKKYGCIPLGDVEYPDSVETFQNYSTKRIIEENGRDKILNGYALMKKADGLSSEPEDHGMMAIEDAHVEYLPDGKIDADKSYIMIQDQRAGTSDYFYEVDVDGETQLFHGRTEYKCTFTYLYEKYYIAVTTAEFLGTEPYIRPEVRYTGSTDSLSGVLKDGRLTSAYPMSIIKFILTDEKGEEILLYRQFLNKRDIESGIARDFEMSRLREAITDQLVQETTDSRRTYTLRVDVTVTNGEILTVLEMPLA